MPHLIQMASYLLPIGLEDAGSAWFRAYVYFDLLASCERVVLAYREAAADRLSACVRIQRESLFERFPVRNSVNKQQFRVTVAEIVRHGCGIAVIPSADGHDEDFAASALKMELGETPVTRRITDDALFLLIRHHAAGRRIRPLFTSLDEDIDRQAVLARFERHHITTEPAFLVRVAA
jgi:3,4-dihydroxy 2-butanone 4-phosphate synthase/GTP cyclohydrolase II